MTSLRMSFPHFPDFTNSVSERCGGDRLREVWASSIPAFVSFAHGVERDKAAIVAGLTLPYSTGPVEGHITHLKLIKRQAYGRASLAYLRKRLLSAFKQRALVGTRAILHEWSVLSPTSLPVT